MARSNLAAAMAIRFREVRETAQRRFDTDTNALNADEQAMSKRALSVEDVARQRAGFASRREVLKRRGEQINHDLAELDKELTRNVVQLALPTIRKVEATRGCAMVLARGSLIDLPDPAADISTDVVETMNATKVSTR